jgi:hypothetical protein
MVEPEFGCSLPWLQYFWLQFAVTAAFTTLLLEVCSHGLNNMTSGRSILHALSECHAERQQLQHHDEQSCMHDRHAMTCGRSFGCSLSWLHCFWLQFKPVTRVVALLWLQLVAR